MKFFLNILAFIGLPYYVIWRTIRGERFGRNSGHTAGLGDAMLVALTFTSLTIQAVLAIIFTIIYSAC